MVKKSSVKAITRNPPYARGCCLLVLTLIVAALLTACTQEESQSIDTAARARQQKAIDLPEGIQAVASLEIIDNGVLWMVASKGDNPSLWQLGENNLWKELVDINELLSLGTSR